MLHERTPERTIAGVTEATAISIHSDDSNDHASTSKDDASAVASAVFTNDDTGTVSSKGAVAAKDASVAASAVGSNNDAVPVAPRSKGASVASDNDVEFSTGHPSFRARRHPSYTLLQKHIWFATLPEEKVKSLRAVCDSVPFHKFKDNSSAGDAGFENEPSFEITKAARRKVNFKN